MPIALTRSSTERVDVHFGFLDHVGERLLSRTAKPGNSCLLRQLHMPWDAALGNAGIVAGVLSCRVLTASQLFPLTLAIDLGHFVRRSDRYPGGPRPALRGARSSGPLGPRDRARPSPAGRGAAPKSTSASCQAWSSRSPVVFREIAFAARSVSPRVSSEFHRRPTASFIAFAK